MRVAQLVCRSAATKLSLPRHSTGASLDPRAPLLLDEGRSVSSLLSRLSGRPASRAAEQRVSSGPIIMLAPQSCELARSARGRQTSSGRQESARSIFYASLACQRPASQAAATPQMRTGGRSSEMSPPSRQSHLHMQPALRANSAG